VSTGLRREEVPHFHMMGVYMAQRPWIILFICAVLDAVDELSVLLAHVHHRHPQQHPACALRRGGWVWLAVHAGLRQVIASHGRPTRMALVLTVLIIC
jgi:hypothetical protein